MNDHKPDLSQQSPVFLEEKSEFLNLGRRFSQSFCGMQAAKTVHMKQMAISQVYISYCSQREDTFHVKY